MYTSDEARSNKKKPWGAIKEVKFETRKNKKGDVNDYLVALNKQGQFVAFKLLELSISIWEMNDFTLMLSAMAAESKFKLMGVYLSLLVKIGFNITEGIDQTSCYPSIESVVDDLFIQTCLY